MPKFYDQIGLSDEQKDQVTRVTETFDDKINNLRKYAEALRRNPFAGMQVFGVNLSINKLLKQRQNLFDEILTAEQKEKYRELKKAQ